MGKFEKGLAVYTPDNFEQFAEKDSKDKDEVYEPDSLDLTELQNYLCAIGNWRPESVLEFKKGQLLEVLTSENILFPSYGEPPNNAILGKSLEEVTTSVF